MTNFQHRDAISDVVRWQKDWGMSDPGSHGRWDEVTTVEGRPSRVWYGEMRRGEGGGGWLRKVEEESGEKESRERKDVLEGEGVQKEEKLKL